jgi:hypothetical protein
MTEIISIQPFNCINEDDAESNYGEISVFSDFKIKGIAYPIISSITLVAKQFQETLCIPRTS